MTSTNKRKIAFDNFNSSEDSPIYTAQNFLYQNSVKWVLYTEKENGRFFPFLVENSKLINLYGIYDFVKGGVLKAVTLRERARSISALRSIDIKSSDNEIVSKMNSAIFSSITLDIKKTKTSGGYTKLSLDMGNSKIIDIVMFKDQDHSIPLFMIIDEIYYPIWNIDDWVNYESFIYLNMFGPTAVDGKESLIKCLEDFEFSRQLTEGTIVLDVDYNPKSNNFVIKITDVTSSIDVSTIHPKDTLDEKEKGIYSRIGEFLTKYIEGQGTSKWTLTDLYNFLIDGTEIVESQIADVPEEPRVPSGGAEEEVEEEETEEEEGKEQGGGGGGVASVTTSSEKPTSDVDVYRTSLIQYNIRLFNLRANIKDKSIDLNVILKNISDIEKNVTDIKDKLSKIDTSSLAAEDQKYINDIFDEAKTTENSFKKTRLAVEFRIEILSKIFITKFNEHVYTMKDILKDIHEKMRNEPFDKLENVQKQLDALNKPIIDLKESVVSYIQNIDKNIKDLELGTDEYNDVKTEINSLSNDSIKELGTSINHINKLYEERYAYIHSLLYNSVNQILSTNDKFKDQGTDGKSRIVLFLSLLYDFQNTEILLKNLDPEDEEYKKINKDHETIRDEIDKFLKSEKIILDPTDITDKVTLYTIMSNTHNLMRYCISARTYLGDIITKVKILNKDNTYEKELHLQQLQTILDVVIEFRKELKKLQVKTSEIIKTLHPESVEQGQGGSLVKETTQGGEGGGGGGQESKKPTMDIDTYKETLTKLSDLLSSLRTKTKHQPTTDLDKSPKAIEDIIDSIRALRLELTSMDLSGLDIQTQEEFKTLVTSVEKLLRRAKKFRTQLNFRIKILKKVIITKYEGPLTKMNENLREFKERALKDNDYLEQAALEDVDFIEKELKEIEEDVADYIKRIHQNSKYFNLDRTENENLIAEIIKFMNDKKVPITKNINIIRELSKEKKRYMDSTLYRSVEKIISIYIKYDRQNVDSVAHLVLELSLLADDFRTQSLIQGLDREDKNYKRTMKDHMELKTEIQRVLNVKPIPVVPTTDMNVIQLDQVFSTIDFMKLRTDDAQDYINAILIHVKYFSVKLTAENDIHRKRLAEILDVVKEFRNILIQYWKEAQELQSKLEKITEGSSGSSQKTRQAPPEIEEETQVEPITAENMELYIAIINMIEITYYETRYGNLSSAQRRTSTQDREMKEIPKKIAELKKINNDKKFILALGFPLEDPKTDEELKDKYKKLRERVLISSDINTKMGFYPSEFSHHDKMLYRNFLDFLYSEMMRMRIISPDLGYSDITTPKEPVKKLKVPKRRPSLTQQEETLPESSTIFGIGTRGGAAHARTTHGQIIDYSRVNKLGLSLSDITRDPWSRNNNYPNLTRGSVTISSHGKVFLDFAFSDLPPKSVSPSRMSISLFENYYPIWISFSDWFSFNPVDNVQTNVYNEYRTRGIPATGEVTLIMPNYKHTLEYNTSVSDKAFGTFIYNNIWGVNINTTLDKNTGSQFVNSVVLIPVSSIEF